MATVFMSTTLTDGRFHRGAGFNSVRAKPRLHQTVMLGAIAIDVNVRAAISRLYGGHCFATSLSLSLTSYL